VTTGYSNAAAAAQFGYSGDLDIVDVYCDRNPVGGGMIITTAREHAALRGHDETAEFPRL
jgi:hypothetical protein